MLRLILSQIRRHMFLFGLVGVMVVMVCFYLVVGLNVSFSIRDSLRTAAGLTLVGDAMIVDSGVRNLDIFTLEGEREFIGLSDWRELLAYIETLPYVRGAVPRLRRWGMVKSELSELPMILVGMDVQREAEFFPGRRMWAGRWMERQGESMMYYRHGDLLTITQGAKVGIGVQTVDGYFNFDTVSVVGLLDYEHMDVYTDFVLYHFVPLSYLQGMLLTNDVAGELLVRLASPLDIRMLSRDVERRFPGRYRVIEGTEASRFLSGVSQMTHFVVYLVALVLVMIVCVCGSFLIHWSIEMRRHEIGVYQAMGVPLWRIALLFSGEFILVVAVFGAIGTWLGMSAMGGIQQVGIMATIPPLQLIFGSRELFVRFFPGSIVGVVLVLGFTVSVTLATALSQLVRLDPVEVLREL